MEIIINHDPITTSSLSVSGLAVSDSWDTLDAKCRTLFGGKAGYSGLIRRTPFEDVSDTFSDQEITLWEEHGEHLVRFTYQLTA